MVEIRETQKRLKGHSQAYDVTFIRDLISLQIVVEVAKSKTFIIIACPRQMYL